MTAKLSRRFYERFGDEITNELVDWLNSVDATYQTTLRDMNEANFARSDARMEQRFAAVESKIEQRFAASEAKIEQRFAAFGARMDGFEARIEARMADFATKEEVRKLGEKLGERISALEAAFPKFEARMIRWMAGLWAGTILTMIGLAFTIARQR